MSLAAATDTTSRHLAAENVSVRFQGLLAISLVSLAIESRQILGLIGPNGAGKTTLVNCFSGFQRPAAGRITIAGRDTAGMSPRDFRLAGVARTFQSGRLFLGMSVLENIEVAAVGLGHGRSHAAPVAREMLSWLGISDKAEQMAGTLAYTDQRRVGIGRALVLEPAYLLLDEPAAGMSEVEAEDLMRLILDIPTTFGCGVLLIEHSMRVVMGVCDRVHVLSSGQTVAEGTPQEIQRNADVIASYLGESEVV